MEKLKNWLKYFFGAFFSHERSKDCEWRSTANTALSMLLAFVILLGSLIFSYNASFGTVYKNAEEFRDFAYSSFDGINAKITDGKMLSDKFINTYDNEFDAVYIKDGYQLICDTRDTRAIFDDFTVMCVSETRPEITYDEYLIQPAYIQADYTTFRAKYSGKILDVEANYEKYHSYLVSVTENENSPIYKKAVAEAFNKLEENKPSDYHNQIYLLYVDTYYPELALAEYNAKAPTLHGYYYHKIASDNNGKFIAILRDNCYISFMSRGTLVFYVGDYAELESCEITDSGAVDAFVHATFESTSQTNLIMYTVNLFGMFAIVLVIWIVLLVIFRIISRKLKIRATSRFGAAGLLVGSYILISSVIGAIIAFVASFFTTQGAAFYLATVSFILAFIIRSIVFLVKEAIYVNNNPSEEEF